MGQNDAEIRRFWLEWMGNGRFQNHDSSGRPRATADREGRLIVRSAVTVPDSSLSTIKRASHTGDWLDHVGIMQTVSIMLESCVVFSAESRFQLWPYDHRRRIWRSPGQRADSAFTITHHIDPQSGVMVRGAFLLTAGLLWSSLDSHLQRNGIHGPYKITGAVQAGEGSVMVYDAWSWRDMGPLIRLDTIMAGEKYKRSPPPPTPTELWTTLQNSWCQLPPALLQTLIESMPPRVAAHLLVGALHDIRQQKNRNNRSTRHACRPSGIVVRDADCGVVGSGFESWERHGCLCCIPSLHCDVYYKLSSM
ncbi:HTH_Tnp_Tc3_2 domain-containing protein [Trichonephila clavipes]|nr:HTH_Tnp_Tc3_2 domain-containing protein [Trichonephila clavipes]